MNVTYLVISILLTVFVIGIFYFLHKPDKSFTDIYTDYILRYNIVPSAFTVAKQDGDKFLNYYVNDGTFEQKIEDFPVNLDGTQWVKSNHGLITNESETGFRISGVDNTFLCPVNWSWSTEKKTCVVEPICLDTDTAGTIKGISQYQFQNLRTNIHYHDRVYAVCTGQNNEYNLEYCQHNYIFNQKKTQAPDSTPCELFDVCSINPTNYIHRYDIPNAAPLEDSQYYICKNGQSTLAQCNNSLVYSTVYNGCVEQNKCWNKSDGYTFYVNDNSYQLCKSEKVYNVSCPNGIYNKDGNDNITCIVDNCNQIFSNYYSNDKFSYPIAAQYCENNNVLQKSCASALKSITYPITSSYSEPKTTLFDTIYYNPQIVVINDGTVFCETINETDLKNYTVHDSVDASEYKYLQSYEWNFLEKKPNSTATFAALQGSIYKIDNWETVDKTNNYLPIYQADEIYKIDKTKFSTIITNTSDGFNYALISTYKTNAALSKNSAFALTCYYFETLQNTYRIAYTNRDVTEFILLDCKNLVISSDRIVKNNDIYCSIFPNYDISLAEENTIYNYYTNIFASGAISKDPICLPQYLSIFFVNNLSELDNNFNMIGSFPIKNLDSGETISSYITSQKVNFPVESTTFTSNSSEFLLIEDLSAFSKTT